MHSIVTYSIECCIRRTAPQGRYMMSPCRNYLQSRTLSFLSFVLTHRFGCSLPSLPRTPTCRPYGLASSFFCKSQPEFTHSTARCRLLSLSPGRHRVVPCILDWGTCTAWFWPGFLPRRQRCRWSRSSRAPTHPLPCLHSMTGPGKGYLQQSVLQLRVSSISPGQPDPLQSGSRYRQVLLLFWRPPPQDAVQEEKDVQRPQEPSVLPEKMHITWLGNC